jgi:hypothetical protein
MPRRARRAWRPAAEAIYLRRGAAARISRSPTRPPLRADARASSARAGILGATGRARESAAGDESRLRDRSATHSCCTFNVRVRRARPEAQLRQAASPALVVIGPRALLGPHAGDDRRAVVGSPSAALVMKRSGLSRVPGPRRIPARVTAAAAPLAPLRWLLVRHALVLSPSSAYLSRPRRDTMPAPLCALARVPAMKLSDDPLSRLRLTRGLRLLARTHLGTRE